MKVSLFALILLLAPVAASAQSMNAEAFYQRASKLERKGMLALFSSDLKLLMNEGKAAGAKARQQRLAAIAAGQKPRYCPPDGPIGIEGSEFLARLSAIAQRDRSRIDMTEAMIRMLAAKYPCRA